MSHAQQCAFTFSGNRFAHLKAFCRLINQYAKLANDCAKSSVS